MNYYNEFDPKAAAWLRELIAQNLIPNGQVDTRSITDVSPKDLSGFTQCHFFAGIGGWSYALQLAGWPQTSPVWTGSCPCQPFSVCGKQLGERDERHLWPDFFRLIQECQPATVLGEQVASKAGRGWLAGVFADLEGVGYAVAGADLCAAGVGAPHIRQRLFWMANTMRGQCEQRLWAQGEGFFRSSDNGSTCGLDKPHLFRSEAGVSGPNARQEGHSGIPDNAGDQPICRERERERVGRVVNSKQSRLEGQPGHEHDRNQSRWVFEEENGPASEASASRPWDQCQLIDCKDGKARRAEPGVRPLAHGVPGRVGILRGYGNAIVPQVAAEFIQATLEAIPGPGSIEAPTVPDGGG